MKNIDLFKDYENAKLTTAAEYAAAHAAETVAYEDLPSTEVEGIPICIRRDTDGRLKATFIENTHLLAIGATRSGKTTGFVIPTINVLMNRKNKPSLVISDPKQELYRSNAQKFADRGYRVLMLDFTDYRHSDCWNPLTKYYRAYQKYLKVEEMVEVVETPDGLKHRFCGVIYDRSDELARAVCEVQEGYLDEVEKGITSLSAAVIPTLSEKDPFWEDSARDLLCAILYGMLEDSAHGSITEETFPLTPSCAFLTPSTIPSEGSATMTAAIFPTAVWKPPRPVSWPTSAYWSRPATPVDAFPPLSPLK